MLVGTEENQEIQSGEPAIRLKIKASTSTTEF